MALVVEAEDESYKWAYLVDPGALVWWVERYSFQRGDFFVWVEPRSYAAGINLGSMRSSTLRIESEKPSLLVNGRDVAAWSGVELERVPGSALLGFGASGAGFTVKFDQIQDSEN